MALSEAIEKQTTIPVQGMPCAACVGRVEKGLRRVDGVHSANVNLATEKATGAFDRGRIGIADLVASVREVGYDVPVEKVQLATVRLWPVLRTATRAAPLLWFAPSPSAYPAVTVKPSSVAPEAAVTT